MTDERVRELHRELQRHQAARDWVALLAITREIASLEPDPKIRGKYEYTMGVVARDEIADVEAALVHFEAALDLDPSLRSAFDAIKRIHTARADFRTLERAYRRMLHRNVGRGDRALEHSLWTELGTIYRDQLNHTHAAKEAFAMADATKPA